MSHSPGFSKPYSAPLNYYEKNLSGYKKDIFSLGVTMYELFFGKNPFYLYSDELK